MNIRFKRTQLTILTVLIILIGIGYSCSSMKIRNGSKMTDEQYYLYLRKDTSICELPELKVRETFLKSLDTIISAKVKFKNCNCDLNPYVYSITESGQNDSLVYVVEILYSTLNLNQFYRGAFKYKSEIFVVTSKLDEKSAFYTDQNVQQIIIPFCDRIYHPEFKYISKIQDLEISIQCIKNEIITIK